MLTSSEARLDPSSAVLLFLSCHLCLLASFGRKVDRKESVGRLLAKRVLEKRALRLANLGKLNIMNKNSHDRLVHRVTIQRYATNSRCPAPVRMISGPLSFSDGLQFLHSQKSAVGG